MGGTVQTTTQFVQLTLFDLETLETAVRQGLASFLEVGEALVKIREGEGYRLRGFDSFEAYCEKQFGFSVRQGQRLIVAAKTTQVVELITGEAPASESVAREFTPIVQEPEVVKTVAQELKAAGKTVKTATAAETRRAVTTAASKHGKPIPKKTGKPQTKPASSKPATNGHKPEPLPEMPPAPTVSTTTTDFCPNCGDLPTSYERRGENWYCGLCGGQVTLNVASA